MRLKFGFVAPTHTDIPFKKRAQVPFSTEFFGVYPRELFYRSLCGDNTADPHWEHPSIPTHKRATDASKRNFPRKYCAKEPHQPGFQGN
jgi:hypothetical protein